MKHVVEITETLQRLVEVEADTIDDAEHAVSSMYRQGDIVLDDLDCVDVSFRATKA